MKIRWLAHETFKVRTGLGGNEIAARLGSAVEPWRLFRNPFSKSHREFEGSVLGSRFKFSRIIHYRNSFLPVVEGRIRDGEVEVSLRLHHVVLAFMIFWLLSAGGIAWSQFRDAASPWAALPGAALFAFGYGICVAGFSFEAERARRSFERVVAAA